jgi:hypothetical protein
MPVFGLFQASADGLFRVRRGRSGEELHSLFVALPAQLGAQIPQEDLVCFAGLGLVHGGSSLVVERGFFQGARWSALKKTPPEEA